MAWKSCREEDDVARMRSGFGASLFSVMLLTAFLVAACGEDAADTTSTDAAPATTATTDEAPATTEGEPGTTSTAMAEPAEVSVILDWLMEGSYAPLLWGIDQGIFAEHGLDVDVIAGQGSDLAMGQINQGEVDFAFTDLETYIIQRANGDTDTTAIHAWLNQATIGVASTEPIEEPTDMVGKSFATVGFSSGPRLLPFVLEENGVDPSSVTIELLDFSVLYPTFLRGEFDTAEAHVPGSAEGLIASAAEQGIEVQVKLLADWGLQSYSKMLIVPNTTIADDPDLVSRFVAATHESLVDAMENATDDHIAALLVEFDAQIDGELQKQVWASFKRVVQDPGPLDPLVIETTLDRLVEIQDLQHDLTAEDLYDNSFIP
jgi:NitT/TauT family transport system substrate-binding protein